MFIALWIGTVLLVCNFSSWYGDEICSRTQYKAHTEKNVPQLIQANIGLSIGLRGINITLFEKACPGKREEHALVKYYLSLTIIIELLQVQMSLCMSKRDLSLRRLSTTMRDSDGVILGNKDD